MSNKQINKTEMKITVVPFLPLNHQKRRRIIELLNLLYNTK